MLCHFLDTFQHFSLKHLSGRHNPIPVELHPPSTHFEQCLRAESLSEQQVWDIVARWQGLRPLQNLYLDPVISSKYTKSLCVTENNAPQKTEILDILGLARYGKENGHSNSEICVFSPSETGRFYTVLTRYWVAIESLKLAQQCHYRLQSTENKAFEEVTALWLQRSGLQESLEVLEVFDFVYGFLCQHTNCSDPDSFTDWIHEEDWMDDQEEEWAFFVKSIRLVLNPADMLELLLFTSLWGEKTSSPSQTWSKEIKTDYLRVRGFFGSGFLGQVTTADVGETPDTWYSTADLERACELQLQNMLKDHPSEVSRAWVKYRTTFWQTDARGQFGQLPSTMLLDSITAETYRSSQS